MKSIPVISLVLGFLAGTRAQVPGLTLSPCAELDLCENANNFNTLFTVALDPKSWTQENMDILCATENKGAFISYYACRIAAEEGCLGEGNEGLVLDVAGLIIIYDFACQEHKRGSITGTCVQDNKAAIETCYNSVSIALTAANIQSKCLALSQLEKCYLDNLAECSQDTRNVVDMFLFKLYPPRCGYDVMRAQSAMLVLAAITAMLISKRNEIYL